MLKRIIALILAAVFLVNLSGFSYAHATAALPSNAYNKLRSHSAFRALEQELRAEGVRLSDPRTTDTELGRVVRFNTGNPSVLGVMALVNDRDELCELIVMRRADNTLEVHSVFSGSVSTVEFGSPDFQTMIIGELVLVASFAIWAGYNWVLLQSLSNGSVVYDAFWSVVIATVYFVVDRYGGVIDEIWYYETRNTYLYQVTVEPNGNIMYH